VFAENDAARLASTNAVAVLSKYRFPQRFAFAAASALKSTKDIARFLVVVVETTMLLQLAVVASAISLWSWFLADCYFELASVLRGEDRHPFIPGRRTIVIATPLILFVSITMTYLLQVPEPPRLPVPCDHGTDFDIRDRLCYPNGKVPLKFQRY
jgi:hypothetical protein